MKNKIIDCITFFQENRHFNLRFNILKEVVDKFSINRVKTIISGVGMVEKETNQDWNFLSIYFQPA